MNGINILKFLTLDINSYSYFGGLFAKDQLKFKFPNRNIFYICNTDFYKNKGKHWVVIFIQKNSSYIEYFDSLGKKPLNEFIKFMSQDNRKILYNTKRLQSKLSAACAYYCLYYIYLRIRGISLNSIINNLTNDTLKNENYVIDFVYDSFFKHKYHYNQE